MTKSRIIRALSWSAIERLLTQIVNFILVLIIARLVSPSDYGLLAMVMVVINFSNAIVDCGFSNALIRKQNRTEQDNCTVFFFNIVVSIILYVLLYAFSPSISSFYEKSELTSYIRVAGLCIIFNAFAIIQQSILISKVDFKTQTKVSLMTTVFSGISGGILAYMGYGIWALIIQQLLQSVFRSMLLWILVRWRISLIFSVDSFKELFGFGSKMMLSSIVVTFNQEIMNLFIGKSFGSRDLGFYNYSQRLSSFPATNMTSIIQRVTYPLLSQTSENEMDYKYKIRQSIILPFALIAPFMLYIFLFAAPIVEIFLTNEWRAVVPILKILSIVMFIWPLLSFNMNLLLVKGRSDISLYLELFNCIVKVSISLVFIQYGVKWFCIGYLLSTVIVYFLYAYAVEKIVEYRFKDQLKDVMEIMMRITFTSLFIYATWIREIDHPLLELFLGGVLLLSFYSVQFKYVRRRILKKLKMLYT